jgi:hypothetical protein
MVTNQYPYPFQVVKELPIIAILVVHLKLVVLKEEYLLLEVVNLYFLFRVTTILVAHILVV